jgi:cyclopropane fatty-acyl-phospholipid synthase-like methyltransferase
MSQTRWEELARQDAEFFIWTDVARGDDFFASGRRDAAQILEWAKPALAGSDNALEIGCGIGRLTLPMSREFGHIVAVDIAPTMLARLAANCADRGVENVTPRLASEPWDASGTVDFAYSHIVFQHIDDWSEITRYFQRISSALRPAGVMYVQFDTRPATWLYRIKTALPDAVLPRTKQRGVRRIRRTGEEILSLARACGLTLIQEDGQRTTLHRFLFRAS